MAFSLGLWGCASTPEVPDAQSALAANDPQKLVEAASPSTKNEDPTPAFSAKNALQWPVDSARMSRGFMPKKKRPHLGIDLAAPKNTPIYAAHDGTVIYVGRAFKGYGRMVMIEGNAGFATLYAHMAKFATKEGHKVKRGELIGFIGRSGHATGNHLHFEVRTAKGPVDPIQYLPFLARTVAHEDDNGND